MRAVVIVAHPRTDSYTCALSGRAVRGLRAAGHSVDVFDLYRLGFRAAMSAKERHAYETDEPILDPLVAEHAAPSSGQRCWSSSTRPGGAVYRRS